MPGKLTRSGSRILTSNKEMVIQPENITLGDWKLPLALSWIPLRAVGTPEMTVIVYLN